MALSAGAAAREPARTSRYEADSARSGSAFALRSLEALWYRPAKAAYALWPLALLYRAAMALRHRLYRAVPVFRTRLAVPVVIVGNITAGGTGKTPLTLWLAQRLQARGRSPAIVCRSYGASARAPARVHPGDDPQLRGDEALLLAAKAKCPVWSGPQRARTARALVAAHPEVDLIVCDDGLQHYALERDVEIGVIDAARAFGNGLPLPAGPLREPQSRLGRLDAIVMNGASDAIHLPAQVPAFVMTLAGTRLRSLVDPARSVEAAALAGKRIAAVAAIGHPGRFFAHLRALGLAFEPHAFPDHHRFHAEELRFPGADAIVMTEKDAIKCTAFADARMWSLPVCVVASDELADLVLARVVRASAAARARTHAT